ncbi:hypothetical protein OOT46_22425 [Aquabacterium sp. A7-Y]|uniref:hypothetical protein n=1 Tax=Aquabacterium sp. A7-Y TaxID=1349605 RepID=UPI00223DBE57|nr:hypothetical protein [Aquabacterium sp. A7-Y]MCW7540584.1 hypothetical protein [Aquabacterium sp. A7-Y]
MLNTLIRWRIAAFERRYGYDAGYLHELLRMSRGGFFRFARATALAQHRQDLPLAAWYAAKLVATRAEDCGPCTQLVVDMAREEGVSDAVLNALLRDELEALDPDTALAGRYARAVVSHAPELGELIESVHQRWGDRGLASLALTVTGTRLYPMLKYALGHGRACQQVRVGDSTGSLVSLPRHAA